MKSRLIETSNLAKELDEKYFAMELPHKFKIGITGCRNNCLKAEENDLGIKGGLKPKWHISSCTYCGVCDAVCPAKAIEVNKITNELKFNEDKCIYSIVESVLNLVQYMPRMGKVDILLHLVNYMEIT